MQATQSQAPASAATSPFVGEEVKFHHNKASVTGKPGETVGIKIPNDGATYRVRLEQVKAPKERTEKVAKEVLEAVKENFKLTYHVELKTTDKSGEVLQDGYSTKLENSIGSTNHGKKLVKDIYRGFNEATRQFDAFTRTTVDNLKLSKAVHQAKPNFTLSYKVTVEAVGGHKSEVEEQVVSTTHGKKLASEIKTLFNKVSTKLGAYKAAEIHDLKYSKAIKLDAKSHSHKSHHHHKNK